MGVKSSLNTGIRNLSKDLETSIGEPTKPNFSALYSALKFLFSSAKAYIVYFPNFIFSILKKPFSSVKEK